MTEIQKKIIYDLRLKGVGYKAIATMLGVSRDNIRGFCLRNGLKGSANVVALNVEERVSNHLLCASCNKRIKQKGRGRPRRFCSDQCRRKWWNDHPLERNKNETAIYKYTCAHCGKGFSCYGNKKRKYCSHDCYIKSRFWSEEDGIQETAYRYPDPSQLQSPQATEAWGQRV